MSERCNCLECRIRAAIHGGPHAPGEPFAVDTGEVLNALGNVSAELLAHHPTKTAKAFASGLLEARKGWLKHPRVMVQQEPGGTA